MEGVNRVRACEQGVADSRVGQIIGNSPALEYVLPAVKRVAPIDSTALILGETGTGKELIARAIHNCSARVGGPFVKLNCAAIPFDLLESPLLWVSESIIYRTTLWRRSPRTLGPGTCENFGT